MVAITICSDFRAQVYHSFPIYCHEVMGPDAMILVFWMLSFKPTFSLSSFSFINRLFNSSHSAIRVVSSAYLRLLIFLPAILIPACASFSPAFYMMYSAYKLNKQSDNIQHWCTPFPTWNQSVPTWNQSVFPSPVLTVASWHAYRFLKRQVRWSGIPISKNFPQFIVILIVEGFGIVNKADIDVFLELSCFFYDPSDVGNLISGSSVFSKTSLTTQRDGMGREEGGGFRMGNTCKPVADSFWYLANLIQLCKV